MARILKFQRQRLASSQVGTPGIDTSTARTAGAFSSTFQAVQGFAANQLIKQKQAQETTEANKVLLDFELGAEEDLNSHKTTYETDPSNKTEFLREQFSERLNTTLDSVESDAVRQTVSNMAQSVIRRKTLKELEWSNKQRAIVSFNNVTSSVDLLAKQAKLAGQKQDEGRFNEILEGVPSTLVAGDTVLSKDEQAQLKVQAPKAVISGYLYGLSDQHPEDALKLIRSGAFDDHFSLKELKQFRNDAESRFKKLDEIREFEILSDGIDQNTGLWDSFRDGQLTVDQIDELEETPFTKQMRDMVLKTNPAGIQQKASTELKLWNSYNALLKKKRGKVKAKGQLEDLLRFQNDVVDAFNKGEVTQDRVNSFMKDLAVPLSNAAKKASGKTGFTGKFKSPFEGGVDVINDWLKIQGQDDDAEVKVRMLGDLVEQMDKVGAFDQEDGTLSVQKVAKLIIEQEKDLRFPERITYRDTKVGSRLVIFGSPVIFEGFDDTTGKPVFSEDTDAR